MCRTPLPEAVHATNRNPLRFGVPKTKVKLQCQWQVRVEIVATPLPSLLPHHARKVIGIPEMWADRRKPRIPHRIPGSIKVFWWTVQIDVVLRTMARVDDIKRRDLGESLQEE